MTPMQLRKHAVAYAKDYWRFWHYNGRRIADDYQTGMWLQNTQEGDEYWVLTFVIPETKAADVGLPCRQWTVELKTNGALQSAYAQSVED